MKGCLVLRGDFSEFVEHGAHSHKLLLRLSQWCNFNLKSARGGRNFCQGGDSDGGSIPKVGGQKQRQLLSDSGFVLNIAPPPLSRDRRIKMKKINQSNHLAPLVLFFFTKYRP